MKNQITHKPLLIAAVLAALGLVAVLWWIVARSDKVDSKRAPNPSSPTVEQGGTVQAPAAKATMTVQVISAQKARAPMALNANGTIAAWQEAIVGAEVNGQKITSVTVNVGDTVRRGQVLATFSNDGNQADYLQAKAQYENAKADADRARSIQDTGALSKQQLSQYFTQEKVSAAQYQAAKVRLSNTTLRAPDNGIISARSATVGAVVGAGQELFRLIRAGRLEWRAELTPQEVGRVKVGQYATLTTPSGANVRAIVRAISPVADSQTRNIIVYLDVPNHPDLKAGVFVKGVFDLGVSEALVIPAEALIVRDGFNYVFLLDAQSKAQMRKVEVGRRIDKQVEILSGLVAGEAVITRGAGFVNQGDTVKVVN